MKVRYRRVSAELCAGCECRAPEGTFAVYHCDYASIKGTCRLDPPGECSHYKKDEHYDPIEAKKRAEEAREKQRIYKEGRKPKSTQPRGRPRKEGTKRNGNTEKAEKGLPRL